MNSADYALQAVKGIKKSFDNACRTRIEGYMKERYIKYYNTTEVSEIFTSTEGMSGVEKLGELTTPPVLNLGDGYSVTIREERFGGAISIPETTYRRDGRDSTLKVDEFLKRERNTLLLSTTKKLLRNAHLMLNEAFDSNSDYLSPDGVEVCGTHTWASGGTFVNSSTEQLTMEAYDNAWEYAGDFVDPSGEEDALNFTHIVCKKGSPAHREAIKLFAKEICPTAVNDINIHEGELTVVGTPYIKKANRNSWFLEDLSLLDSPLAVGIGEYPTIREPIKETNESIRSNCTGFWKQGVLNMPFQIYGSSGTV